MFRQDEQRPMTSQFAVRVAVLGGIAVVAFAVIFFRLWYLEVLSGEAYRAAADSNRVREIRIQAGRGEILDRKGRLLVRNRTALSLQVRPDQLPKRPRARNRVIGDLSEVAKKPVPRIKREIREQSKLMPASPVTLERDVDRELVYYLRERQDQFPGISVEEVYVRDYPRGSFGAHLFGYVSEISEEQLSEPQYEGLEMGDRIGATGLEAQYDNSLRGRNGAIRVQVDAFGRPRGRQLSEVRPKVGNNLVTTLDAKIQEAGEAAISQFGKPAAFVVMNVNDGSVLGMGSYPSFDPGIYTPPVSAKKIESLTNAEMDPLVNKATQSAYPTGSTFKLITSTAAVEEGLITPPEAISDGGVLNYGGRDWINAGRQAHGSVDLTASLRVSSDIYYYLLGIEANQVYEDTGELVLQDWARDLGFGGTTGVDLPGEGAGFVPTPEWRNELYEQATDPDSPGGREAIYPEETDRPWSVGDMMNLTVGQGDLQATPLQLAVAYATMANGGNVVRPHLAQEVESPTGTALQEITPAPRRELDISEETRSAVMEGLRQAAMEAGGTSVGIFGNWPIEIAGKTGTAETTSGEDQSWYAAIAPFDNPEIAVAVTIEGGGFGAESAAPAAAEILKAYFPEVGEEELAGAEDAASPETAVPAD
jgi:penicillin-binding protein 2